MRECMRTCVCMYVRRYVSMYVSMNIYICIHVYMCVFVGMSIYICIHVYTCVFVGMSIYMYVWAYTCTYEHVRVRVYLWAQLLYSNVSCRCGTLDVRGLEFKRPEKGISWASTRSVVGVKKGECICKKLVSVIENIGSVRATRYGSELHIRWTYIHACAHAYIHAHIRGSVNA